MQQRIQWDYLTEALCRKTASSALLNVLLLFPDSVNLLKFCYRRNGLQNWLFCPWAENWNCSFHFWRCVGGTDAVAQLRDWAHMLCAFLPLLLLITHSEPQNTPNRAKRQSGRLHAFWFQTISQNYSNQNSVITGIKQTQSSMEQNRPQI